MSHLNLSKLITLAGLALASLLPNVQAQPQDIELFDQPRFNGVRLRLPGDTPDVAAYGLGGRIASVVVQRGQWEFCTAPNYGGACITIGPGRYAEMPPAMRGNLASVRRADAPMTGAPRPGNPPGGPFGGVINGPGRGPIVSPIGPIAGQRGEPIVLFEHSNFDGRALALNGASARLTEHDFNDAASSLLIQRGRWQLCEHVDFAGECMILGPGRHVLSGRFNDFVSSVRPLFGQDSRPMERSGAVVLHENVDFSGRQVTLTDANYNLTSAGMNDVASAIEVWGGQWELCTDANYQGQCVVVGPGRYRLEGNLNDRISSIRPR